MRLEPRGTSKGGGSPVPDSLQPQPPCALGEGHLPPLRSPRAGEGGWSKPRSLVLVERTEGSLSTCTYLENLNLGKRIEFLM